MVISASFDVPDYNHGSIRLMSGSKLWLDTGALLRSGILRDIFTAEIRESGEPSAPNGAPSGTPAATSTSGNGPHDASQEKSSTGISWRPVPRMGEVDGHDPSLATRTRPDLPSAAQRHQDFSSSYLDPKAKDKTLRQHKKGSLNVVFHGQMDNGHQYIAKPNAGLGHREKNILSHDTFDELQKEAPDNANRHNATYELMAAMGAHHMVAPGMTTNMHGRHQFNGPDPDEDDDEQKRLTMASSHAGKPAHVQEFIPHATAVAHASPDQLNGVDSEHRIHGMVSHLLFGNQDAHGENVLIHPSGHPILIDHDMTLSSGQAVANKEHFGKDAFRSSFSPGNALDYRAKLPKDANGKMIPVGTNYPPRMAETLRRAAEGYYSSGSGKLGLSAPDNAALQKNARELLSYGLEGVLSRRHDIDASNNAIEAQKQAENDAINANDSVSTKVARTPQKRR